MFEFNENTIECLRKNFEVMVLTDKIILGLFLVASNFDDDDYCPTHWGNLYAFMDIKSDEWLCEIWESFEDEDDLSIKEKLEIVRSKLVIELKNIINEDITY
jgi:hypothetical protein